MDHETEALEKICGDMDDMESDRMFKKPEEEKNAKGVAITISVEPKIDEEKPEPEEMNKGGEVCADDDTKLPPFLRKKK